MWKFYLFAGGGPICKPAASLDSVLDASAKLGVFLSQDAVALHTADRTIVAALSPTGIVPVPYTGMRRSLILACHFILSSIAGYCSARPG